LDDAESENEKGRIQEGQKGLLLVETDRQITAVFVFLVLVIVASNVISSIIT
jgi:hypothetical protein